MNKKRKYECSEMPVVHYQVRSDHSRARLPRRFQARNAFTFFVFEVKYLIDE